MSTDTKENVTEYLNKNTKWVFWYGVGLVVVGIIALLFPIGSTLASELFVGFAFLFAGIVSFAGSFSIRGAGPFFGALLWGLLQIAAGMFMLVNPLAGALALTLVIAILFMFQGAYELAFAFSMAAGASRRWVIVSAIISIAAGILVITGLPGISLVMLGVIVGVNFLSSGIALLMLHRKLRPGTSPGTSPGASPGASADKAA